MKKMLVGCLIALVLITSVSFAQSYEALKASFPIVIDGERWTTDKPIVVINGSTYLPLRAIGEVLETSVNWNDSLRRVEIDSTKTVAKGSNTNQVTSVEQKYEAIEASFPIIIDGEEWHTDKPVVVIAGSTYLPLRAIGEVLGTAVNWNEGLRRVEIGDGKKISNTIYDYIAVFSEGFAVVEKSGKYGYINTNGEEVIECKYDDASNFSKGLASVNLNSKWSVINVNGEKVVDFKNSYKSLVVLSDNFIAISNEEYQIGFIDFNEKVIVKCKYDSFMPCGDGLYSVTLEDKIGLINSKGEEIVKCKYDFMWPFHYGPYDNELTLVEMDGMHGFINKKGEEVIPCKYVDTTIFNEGLAAVQTDFDKWEYIDEKGKKVMEVECISVERFEEGLACVKKRIDQNYKCGFINTRGETVIDYKYDSVGCFSEGIALALKDGKWGYINRYGEEVIGFKYKNAREFYNGLAMVEKDDGNMAYINRQGNEIALSKRVPIYAALYEFSF